MSLPQLNERILIQFAYRMTDSATPDTFTWTLNSTPFDVQLDSLMLCNSDTIDHTVSFTIFDIFEDNVVGSALIPAGAGMGAVPIVDAIAAMQPSGLHYLMIGQTFGLGWTVREAINTGKMVHLYAQGGSV